MFVETGQIIPVAPFDFTRSQRFLGSFAPMEGEQTTTGQSLTKALFAAGQLVLVQLTSTGTIEQPRLDYTLHSEKAISKTVKEAAIERMSFFLSLEDDLRPFYEIAQEDSDFAPVVRDLYGYHQVKFGTPFENGCWAILSQRNPRTMAQRMKRALLETYGASIELDGTRYWAFPEPAHLAGVSEADLFKTIRNTLKAERLYGVVQAFQDVDETYLRNADYDEVDAWLRSIRGFGEWSASFVLLRGLGRMDRVPLDEKALLAAASRLYGHGQELTRAQVAALAERYGPDKGYWAHYLRVGA
ncbi:MAG TPA: hypothetical protein VKX46_15380 [Ktedonobacteraceae bacterium]|nr:hypothetical protein [Ktedonobacteraceae bacterium]